ncbi:hypothetical protein GCM10009838_01270 [Catenulispora subtropica]|uniref:Uncharacterized protein n=1 Tax=Catenulispora subtropica TaxID=450798 RepID=A0ABN2QD47_9ACTN
MYCPVPPVLSDGLPRSPGSGRSGVPPPPRTVAGPCTATVAGTVIGLASVCFGTAAWLDRLEHGPIQHRRIVGWLTDEYTAVRRNSQR